MHIRTNIFLNVAFRPFLLFCEWLGTVNPEALVKLRYIARFKKPLNLDNPETLNEKILYLSLRTDTTLWTRCSDKYEVRHYIKEQGLDNILIPLLGVWDNADDLDLNQLPEQFILKANHGCGDVKVCRNKSNFDINSAKAYYKGILAKQYGALEGGHHYMRIKPRLIAEQLLNNDSISQKYSSSIIDYKIWCFNGKASFIMTCANRKKHSLDLMLYDRDWNAHPEYMNYGEEYPKCGTIPKPNSYEKMLTIAEKLAEPFPVLRVDLYNINGQIYFGEMTFTSLGGLMNYYTPEFQKLAGNMIILR